jgi:tetratricopeptide (TPR) repeat protein
MNPGDRFLRYRIVKQLGWGQFGEVYLADNLEKSGSPVALKLVRKAFDEDDRMAQQAERAGAELQKQLCGHDRRVTAVNSYGFSPSGELFIDMEYVEGEDLSAPISRRALTWQNAAEIAFELCEMLDNLSKFRTEIDGKAISGVVHGDLKPRNIRLNRNGEVKVVDFGISKALSETRTHTRSHWASKPYASPERLETGTVDMRSDLWSVGVLLYQMISGELPFQAEGEQLEARIRSAEPPPPLPDSCPEPLRNIVFKMLARDPAARYATAAAAAADLKSFLEGRPVAADLDETVRVTPPRTEPRSAPDSRNWAPRRARKLWIAGAIMVLLAIFARSQYGEWRDARQLRTDIELDRVSNLDDACARYKVLEKRWHMFPLYSTRNALRAKLVSAGSDPILDYRNNEVPTARENQWRRAIEILNKALELDPADKGVKGSIRLCEGHLNRILASYQPNTAKGTAARTKFLNIAAAKFREAADLLDHSPDPYLGLARIYTYDLNDLEKARSAFEMAQKYGHAIGRREKVQLADGYLARIRRTWNDSRALTEMPEQEKEYLVRAQQDCSTATDLYQQVGVFAGAVRNFKQLIESCDQVNQRIQEIDSPKKSWWPW